MKAGQKVVSKLEHKNPDPCYTPSKASRAARARFIAPKALFDQQEIAHPGSKKTCFTGYIDIYSITLVWLFERLDEVRRNNFRPLKKNLGYVCVLKDPENFFRSGSTREVV